MGRSVRRRRQWNGFIHFWSPCAVPAALRFYRLEKRRSIDATHHKVTHNKIIKRAFPVCLAVAFGKPFHPSSSSATSFSFRCSESMRLTNRNICHGLSHSQCRRPPPRRTGVIHTQMEFGPYNQARERGLPHALLCVYWRTRQFHERWPHMCYLLFSCRHKFPNARADWRTSSMRASEWMGHFFRCLCRIASRFGSCCLIEFMDNNWIYWYQFKWFCFRFFLFFVCALISPHLFLRFHCFCRQRLPFNGAHILSLEMWTSSAFHCVRRFFLFLFRSLASNGCAYAHCERLSTVALNCISIDTWFDWRRTHAVNSYSP